MASRPSLVWAGPTHSACHMAMLIVCLKESHLLNNNGSIIQVSTRLNKDDIYLRKMLDNVALQLYKVKSRTQLCWNLRNLLH